MPTTLTSLDDLLLHELRDLYSAETQLTEALPLMIGAATHDDLKTAFNDHLEETRGHIDRLRRALDHLGQTPEGEHCEAMEGLIKEAQETINQRGEPNVKDAALIASAQRVEHYEIAGYGSAHTYAKQLGRSEIASLLNDTLDEEKAADKKLNKLATGGWLSSGINKEAKEHAR